MNEQPEFLYRIQPARPEKLVEGRTNQEAELVAQHFRYLQDLLVKGGLILAGSTQNTNKSSFGIVVFRASSEAEARTIMEGDPAVKSGVMLAELSLTK